MCEKKFISLRFYNNLKGLKKNFEFNIQSNYTS